MIGKVMPTIMAAPLARSSGGTEGAEPHVRVVVGQGFLPPVRGHRPGLPVGERVDAVDGAGRQALVAATAQLGDDDDVGSMVEDGAELWRTVTQARIAVDALEHLDAQ